MAWHLFCLRKSAHLVLKSPLVSLFGHQSQLEKLQDTIHLKIYRFLEDLVISQARGKIGQGWIQDLIKGGRTPDRDRPKLPMVLSSVMRVKRALFSVGSEAHLRALEALGYFITKYAFSPFWGTFLYYFWNNTNISW